eukprot:g1496.t1
MPSSKNYRSIRRSCTGIEKNSTNSNVKKRPFERLRQKRQAGQFRVFSCVKKSAALLAVVFGLKLLLLRSQWHVHLNAAALLALVVLALLAAWLALLCLLLAQ